MELIQILDCSATLNNCCSSFAIANVLDITRKIFDLVQMLVPIVLILMATVQFVQLTINPELKDGFRRVLNKIVAAFIIFLLPVLTDAVLGLVPGDVQVSACWKAAKETAAVANNTTPRYIAADDEDDMPTVNTKANDSVVLKSETVNGKIYGSTPSISGTGYTQVVNYAKQFVGKGYVYGGTWNGELPYKKTDCSGFIRGVYLHFGVDLPHGCHAMISDKDTYKLSATDKVQAGDIVVYPKHCAMIIGDGNKIIHARSEKLGIAITPNYRYQKIDAILRVKGVK